MKVMLVIPHLSGGGGERVLSDLAAGLRTHELVLVVFEKKFGYPFDGRIVSLDLPIRRASLLGRASGFLRRCRQFRRVIHQEKPDAVVSFMGEANLLNALFAPRPIITVHNHLSSLTTLERVAAKSPLARVRKAMENTASEALMRKLYKRTTVVAVGEDIKRELVQHFRVPEKKIVVIQNAIRAAEVRAKASEPVNVPWQRDVPAIISVGRLTLQKGQWHLIRAFSEARRKLRCQLVILGTGELEVYLKGLVKELAIEQDVFFPGWQANPFKFMARGDLFALPSLTEGFPLVMLEAMTCGLPVVATDCPGDSREIIAPGTYTGAELKKAEEGKYGVLVPNFDMRMRDGREAITERERQLADVIVRLLQDKEKLRHYAEASSVRIGDFDEKVFIERYRRLIESRLVNCNT